MILQKLTNKEEEVMELIWKLGACSPKDVQSQYDEPQPSVSTVATSFQSLERKGYLTHRPQGRGYVYEPAVKRDSYGRKKLTGFVTRFFDNSYKNVVSALVEEEKISPDELMELLNQLKTEAKS